MKKIKSLITLFMLIAICFLGFACGKEEQLNYVTIETNPSVELICDENNIVVAVNGLNEDGKLLIADEEFEGKNIEAAAELVISLTESMGFTVSGSINASPQEIKISVSGSASEEDIKILQMKVNEKIESVATKLGINAEATIENSKSKDYFEKIACTYDPSLTEEQAEAMTMKELMDVVKLATLEKAEFCSVKLEEYYASIKEYEFKLKYKEEIASSLGSAYADLLETYNKALESFKTLIDDLKKKEIEFFTSADSVYVKALNSYNEKKAEVLELNVEAAVSNKKGDKESTASLKIQIGISESVLKTLDETLKLAENTIRSVFAKIIENLEAVYAQLEELEKTFPTEINFEEKLTNAENYINANKDELFAKFESSITKAKLDEMKEAMLARKAELKNSVSNAKNK